MKTLHFKRTTGGAIPPIGANGKQLKRKPDVVVPLLQEIDGVVWVVEHNTNPHDQYEPSTSIVGVYTTLAKLLDAYPEVRFYTVEHYVGYEQEPIFISYGIIQDPDDDQLRRWYNADYILMTFVLDTR